MKAVILQPFYMPWVGYFGMIDASDIFVFADDLQFIAKSWQRRNKIKNVNKPKWLTVPVHKNFGQKINEVKINKSTTFKEKNRTINWREKHWELISFAYHKAPYYEDLYSQIKEIYYMDWDLLVDLNIYSVEKISKVLGLKTPKFIRKSEIEGLDGRKVDSIVSICDKIGADEYISGPAARNYIDHNEFQKLKQNNIDLYWFEFDHPEYPQIGDDFIPYLSVIDMLLNAGEESLDLIRNSLENSLVIEDGSSLK
jgi:hypothetical protein